MREQEISQLFRIFRTERTQIEDQIDSVFRNLRVLQSSGRQRPAQTQEKE